MATEGSCCGPTLDRAALRRQRIIDAARVLFVENGFHATGVAQIARQSGVQVGQLYRDFEAKEDIVAAIVESDCAVLMARESLDQAIAHHDADAVWAWLRHVIEPAAGDTEPLFAEIVAESTRNVRISAIFARTQEVVSGNMHAALAVLVPGDDFARRRELLADLILSQSIGLMQHRLLRPGLDTGALVDMTLSAIAREIDVIQSERRGE